MKTHSLTLSTWTENHSRNRHLHSTHLATAETPPALGKGEADSSILSGSTSKNPLYHRVIGGAGPIGYTPAYAEQVMNAHQVVASQRQTAAGGVHGVFAAITDDDRKARKVE